MTLREAAQYAIEVLERIIVDFDGDHAEAIQAANELQNALEADEIELP